MAFRFADEPLDHGLDAMHVQADGEVWFSVDNGFVSSTAGGIQGGDLLSDQGFIVIRNLDLVQPFSPLEDLADFGLDGLWLVTDVAPGSGQRPTLGLPRLTTAADREIELHWDGPGRVFQAEQASEPAGPYVAASPILAAREWRQQTGPPGGARFYRVRQW